MEVLCEGGSKCGGRLGLQASSAALESCPEGQPGPVHLYPGARRDGSLSGWEKLDPFSKLNILGQRDRTGKVTCCLLETKC